MSNTGTAKREQRQIRGIASTVLAALVLVGGLGAWQWDVVWAAVPGRIGPPANTITLDEQESQSERAVRLAVLGDVGTGEAAEWDTACLVATAAATDPFDALILLGDNVYPNGDATRLDGTVYRPFGPILQRGAALLPVLGNHDVQGGNTAAQVEALRMPGRWYATEIGPVLIIALDSNLVDDSDQKQWLETTLTTASAEWVIVAMHHPPYSAGYHGSTEAVQEEWVPILEENGVDLVLAGHDHDYQRTHPINGTTYIVSGGGAKTRPTAQDGSTAYAASVLHYLDIGIWNDHIDVTAHSAEGPFDHITLDPTVSATTSPPSALPDPVAASRTTTRSALGIGALGATLWILALVMGWYAPPRIVFRVHGTVLTGTTVGMLTTITGFATAITLAAL